MLLQELPSLRFSGSLGSEPPAAAIDLYHEGFGTPLAPRDSRSDPEGALRLGALEIGEVIQWGGNAVH